MNSDPVTRKGVGPTCILLFVRGFLFMGEEKRNFRLLKAHLNLFEAVVKH